MVSRVNLILSIASELEKFIPLSQMSSSLQGKHESDLYFCQLCRKVETAGLGNAFVSKAQK